MSGPDKDSEERGERPLDDLLSLRGKPFKDWQEEREYLRRKWGEQGKQVSPGVGMGVPVKEDAEMPEEEGSQ